MGGLYNMLMGVTPATFWVLPMLGKHPDEYPRFRDCFLRDEEHPEYDGHIMVYTRTGGANRESYVDEIEAMRAMETYVTDFDDSQDNTYASFVFLVPEKWAADYALIKASRVREVSEAYQQELRRVYPRFKEKFDKFFSRLDLSGVRS